MRRALGKGLTQLMGEQSAPPSNTLPVSSLRPNAQQPRRHFDQESLEQLAKSIAEVGVLLPLIVRPVSEDNYEIIAGERRWRAAQMAGLEEVPVIVRSASAQDSLELAIIENVQREDISAIECAHAYKELIDKFGLSQEQVADKVGKSRVAVTNTLRLLQLPQKMQDALVDGSMTEGHARALLTAEAGARESLFKRVVAEGLSVRETERLARGPDAVAGTGAPVKVKSHTRTPSDPNMAALENGLSQYFGSPVKIERAETGGRIVVAFYSDEDLQRILDVLGVGL